MSRAIFYALTSDKFIYFQLERSLRSLRKFNSQIPVRVFHFGKVSPLFISLMEGLLVETVECPELEPDVYPYLVKWIALEHMTEESVLLLDADTLFFRDPEILFNDFQRAHIYARRPPEHQPKINFYGSIPARRALLPDTFRLYFEADQSRFFPILNVGVVLFNHGFHRLISAEVLRKEQERLNSGEFPYPSRIRHNQLEYALALVLARMKKEKGFLRGEFGLSKVPFFEELPEAKGPILAHLCFHNYNRYFSLRKAEVASESSLVPESKLALRKDICLSRIPGSGIRLVSMQVIDCKPSLHVDGPLAEVIRYLDGEWTIGEASSYIGLADSTLGELLQDLERLREDGYLKEVQ